MERFTIDGKLVSSLYRKDMGVQIYDPGFPVFLDTESVDRALRGEIGDVFRGNGTEHVIVLELDVPDEQVIENDFFEHHVPSGVPLDCVVSQEVVEVPK